MAPRNHLLGLLLLISLAGCAGTTAIALFFTAAGWGRRPWWIAAGLGIAVMAWSRTYLQVHWLSDVVAGAALGIGVALVVFGAAQRRRPV